MIKSRFEVLVDHVLCRADFEPIQFNFGSEAEMFEAQFFSPSSLFSLGCSGASERPELLCLWPSTTQRRSGGRRYRFGLGLVGASGEPACVATDRRCVLNVLAAEACTCVRWMGASMRVTLTVGGPPCCAEGRRGRLLRDR